MTVSSRTLLCTHFAFKRRTGQFHESQERVHLLDAGGQEQRRTNPPLRDDLACEVTPLSGAESPGRLVAYYLTAAGGWQSGAGGPSANFCHGSTAASTGLLQYEIDTPLCELAGKVGERDAARAYLLCLRSLDSFRRIVEDLDDDASLTPKPSLYLASGAGDVEDLKEEYAARRACGIDVQFLSEGAIRERFSFRRPGALFSQSAMEVDPYRLAQALLRRSVQRGLAAFSRTEIAEYLPDENGVTLLTTHRSSNPRARARSFSPPAMKRLRWRARGTDNAQEHICPGNPAAPIDLMDGTGGALIWETARPYFYLRAPRQTAGR